MRFSRITKGKSKTRDTDRALRDLADSLDLPTPFTIEGFCSVIAAQRNRKLHIHAIDHRTAEEIPCGVWIATDIGDHIFVEDATSPMHRAHIILHELCHMLLGHTSVPGTGAGPVGVFASDSFSGISPETVSSMLGRTSYTTKDEQDAEALAGLIAERIQEESSGRPSDDRLVTHLLQALREA
ncbi:hypothetical protein [Kitasatospora sp. NPDC051914]|uniref:hypothetical protein n=1 Tax=Kitasatospora sp. NPDC051914 TaxID=3154945 RepID=UPI00343652FA